jgi:hypothetical protein
MKAFNKFLILIAMTLVCGLVTAIVFLTIPDARLASEVFWLAFAFAIPWNLLVAVILHLWAGKKQEETLRMPVAYYVCGVFGIIYLVVGIIFMYAPATELTFPLILELIITVVYLLVIMYCTRAAAYIGNMEKTTKKKVLFIRLLQADVQNCAMKATDPATKAALERLAESVRFSDPMSHEALAMQESELMATVTEISQKLNNGEDVTALIQKANVQLESRNSRCLLLK